MVEKIHIRDFISPLSNKGLAFVYVLDQKKDFWFQVKKTE